MLDADLAQVYGVSTKRLNEQVKRNSGRFPADFMFQLSAEELENWRSQIATSNSGAKMGLRRRPYAFTEHGAVMAASVLNTNRAVQVSIFVVRAFVKLREVLAANQGLAQTLAELERKLAAHDTVLCEHKKEIEAIVLVLRKLMDGPKPRPRLRIGGFKP